MSQLEYLAALREAGDIALISGDKVQASTHFREYLRLVRERLDQAALAQSEQEQLLMAEQYRSALDRYLSLPPQDEGLETLYQQVLIWKGATLVRQHQIRALRSRAELKPQFQQWELTSMRLAAAATRLPFKEEAGFWRRQVEFLAHEKDRLEVELMRHAPADSLTPVPTVAQLRAVIPARTVLIDFVEYEHRQASSEAPDGMLRERRLIAFLLGPNLPLTRVDLGSADEAKLHIERWREASERVTDLVFDARRGSEEARAAIDPALEHLGAESLQLRRSLWLPLTIHLDKVETVLLSPDGALTIFPFGSLPGTKQGAFLLEEYAFAVVPAPRLLPAMFAKAASTGGGEPSLLAFGGVDYFAAPERREEQLPVTKTGADLGAAAGANENVMGAGLFPRERPAELLMNTGPEMERLAVMFREKFPSAPLEKFADAAASENQFRRHAPNHRWLHLATHGFYYETLLKEAQLYRRTTTPIGGSVPGLRQVSAPPVEILRPELTSGLTMAGANEANASDEDDGVLWSMEIAACDLSRVEMVVLSACEASQGMIIPGEGTHSLQRAFQTAGARSIVSTLWPVNDLATRLLMQRFYKNLLENPSMSKLEAMREAQLWMIAAARRTINEEPADPGELTETSRYLPAIYALPSFWAAFVVTGEWR
jgi:CHAT domain-containing protein